MSFATAQIERLDDALRLAVGERLERGLDVAWLGGVARATGAFAAPRVARPLRIPRGLRTIGVGSAALGGAGKTPVAIAIARELASRGEVVALIGHAYRAQPGAPRVVSLNDPVREVGDDALAAAIALALTSARVVVGPTRESAVAFAARQGARVVVLDGLLQSAPERLDDSVLMLGAVLPRACPPLGDLRAPTAALLAAADHVVTLDGDAAAHDRAVVLSSSVHAAAQRGQPPIRLAELRDRRVGLVLGIAHAERVQATLNARGIRPVRVARFADHARFSPASLASLRGGDVEVWLTTARDATKLPSTLDAAPVLALVHEIDPGPLVARLLAASRSRR